MPTVLSRSDTVPAAARVLVGASVRLLVRADEALVRASDGTRRLLDLLPEPRAPFDEL